MAHSNNIIAVFMLSADISFVMDKNPIKAVKELGCILEADRQGRESSVNRINTINGSIT